MREIKIVSDSSSDLLTLDNVEYASSPMKVSIGHCQNEGAATKLKQMIESTFEKVQVEIHTLSSQN